MVRSRGETNLKTAAMGAVFAVGLVSASAFAQSSNNQKAPANPQMNHEMMMRDGGMMGMMNDPEMRKQMSRMMSNCNKMMESMNTKGAATPRS